MRSSWPFWVALAFGLLSLINHGLIPAVTSFLVWCAVLYAVKWLTSKAVNTLSRASSRFRVSSKDDRTGP